MFQSFLTVTCRLLAMLVVTLGTAVSVSAQPRAYVVNRVSNDVSIIDTLTHRVIGTVAVESTPTEITVTPDQRFIYVASQSVAPSISIIDAADSTVVGHLTLNSSPQGMVFTPDGAFLYVLLPREVAIVDTISKTVVASVPLLSSASAIAIAPNGVFAYVTYSSLNTVSVISTGSREVVASIKGVGSFIAGLDTITILPGSKVAYATSRFWFDVYILDLECNLRVGAIRLPGAGGGGRGGGLPSPIAVATDGRIFASNYLERFISVYDPVTRTVTKVPTTNAPRDIAITPDGAFAYASGPFYFSDTGNEVDVIDTATLTVVDRIDVGLSPGAIAMASLDFNEGPVSHVSHLIPGRIEAEDYDLGGEGVGYLDASAGNAGLVYRTDDVDIKASEEGGYAVGWINAGESLTYQAAVQFDGTYTIQARVGSAMSGRTMHVEIDGADVTGPIPVPELAGWDRYETVAIPGVPLHRGRQRVRVVAGPEDYFDLQWIGFALETDSTPAGPFSGAPSVVTQRIQAEHYDRGGPELAYHDTSIGNEQGFAVYRTDDVDIKPSREGGHAVGWLTAGEWLTYTVDIGRSAKSTMIARVGSLFPGRTLNVEIDGVDATGPIAVPQVAEWDEYENVKIHLSVSPGLHEVRIVMGPEDFMDLQWFYFP